MTGDADWEEVRLLKLGMSPSQVRLQSAWKINTVQSRALWPPLKDVPSPSAQEGNRKDYLKKNVLDRYDKGDCGVALVYFGNGKE